MDNLKIYNAVRKVPQEAQSTIIGGRLKGKTDINPMWRIKTLTEQFGIVGIGWKYEITKQWIEEGGDSEKAAFCNINLFVKNEGEWSEAIPGTGGSSFITKERAGLYTSDECFKMSLTDALSVACKALGIGADIYWQKDISKYDRPEKPEAPEQKKTPEKTKQQPLTTPNNDPDHKLRVRLGKMAMELADDNKEEAQKLIGLYSEFKNEKGEIVQNKDYSKLKNKWLKSTYGKCKADYISNYGEDQFNKKFKEGK